MARDLRSSEVVAHGWTVTDVEHISQAAATRHAETWLPWAERVVAARDGVLDALFDSAEAPGTRELVNAAHAGIAAEIDAILRGYGVTHGQGQGYHLSPKFAAYWVHTPGRTTEAGFAERLTDNMAACEVWSQMREWDRIPIRALIEEGSYEAAARELKITMHRFQSRLGRARRRARELWFWPETAPKQYARVYLGRKRDDVVLNARRNIYQLRYKHKRAIRREQERKATAKGGGVW